MGKGNVYRVTSNMEKKFCPKCGNASLLRVSCSTDSKGRIKYHLKHGFQYRLRGTKVMNKERLL